MNQLIFILMLFSISLLAREEMLPSQECPAFNNMKRTQNTHSVHLDTRLDFE
jgi:ribonuclease T2